MASLVFSASRPGTLLLRLFHSEPNERSAGLGRGAEPLEPNGLGIRAANVGVFLLVREHDSSMRGAVLIFGTTGFLLWDFLHNHGNSTGAIAEQIIGWLR